MCLFRLFTLKVRRTLRSHNISNAVGAEHDGIHRNTFGMPSCYCCDPGETQHEAGGP